MNIMGRLLHFLLMVFVLSLFMGCHSYVEVMTIKPYNYKPKDYITKVLSVYEPKESLFPVLDSIIMKTEECPEYQNRKEKVFFYFSINDGNTSGAEQEWNNPLVRISVNYYVFRLSDFRWVEGLFHYRGYDFYVNERFVDILLKKTDQMFPIRCVSPEKFRFDPLYRGDGDMYWCYRYKHGMLKNTQYGRCPTPNL